METKRAFKKTTFEGLLALEQVSRTTIREKKAVRDKLVVTDGVATMTSDQFIDHAKDIMCLGEQGRLKEVMVSDPLQPEIDIRFKIFDSYDAGLPMVPLADIYRRGFVSCLGGHDRVLVHRPDFSVVGSVELGRSLPDALTAFSKGLPQSRIVKPLDGSAKTFRNFDGQNIRNSQLFKDAHIRKAIQRLKTSHDFLNIYNSADVGKEPEPKARLWRPDAPIQADEIYNAQDIVLGLVHRPRKIFSTHASAYWLTYYDCLAIVTHGRYEIDPTLPIVRTPYTFVPSESSRVIGFKNPSLPALEHALDMLSGSKKFWEIVSGRTISARLSKSAYTYGAGCVMDEQKFMDEMTRKPLRDIFEQSGNVIALSVGPVANARVAVFSRIHDEPDLS